MCAKVSRQTGQLPLQSAGPNAAPKADQGTHLRMFGSAALYVWLLALFLCIVPAREAHAFREWVLSP